MTRFVEIVAESERLDRIARGALGSERDGGLEALLAANPGAAARGPSQPFGTRLALPETIVKPDPTPSPRRPWE